MFVFSLFFFNDTATTEIYTLSLHDALPISPPLLLLLLLLLFWPSLSLLSPSLLLPPPTLIRTTSNAGVWLARSIIGMRCEPSPAQTAHCAVPSSGRPATWMLT